MSTSQRATIHMSHATCSQWTSYVACTKRTNNYLDTLTFWKSILPPTYRCCQHTSHIPNATSNQMYFTPPQPEPQECTSYPWERGLEIELYIGLDWLEVVWCHLAASTKKCIIPILVGCWCHWCQCKQLHRLLEKSSLWLSLQCTWLSGLLLWHLHSALRRYSLHIAFRMLQSWLKSGFII